MEVELLSAVLLITCVYVLARIVNHIEDAQRLEKYEKAEQERLKKVAALYGREK